MNLGRNWHCALSFYLVALHALEQVVGLVLRSSFRSDWYSSSLALYTLFSWLILLCIYIFPFSCILLGHIIKQRVRLCYHSGLWEQHVYTVLHEKLHQTNRKMPIALFPFHWPRPQTLIYIPLALSLCHIKHLNRMLLDLTVDANQVSI